MGWALVTKTVPLPAEKLNLAFGRGPGGKPMVANIDPSSKLVKKLNVGDIVVGLETNKKVTYQNLSLTDLVEKIRGEENKPNRTLTVIDSNSC